MKWTKNTDVQKGLLAGVPIVIGYLPIAMTFGILSKSLGISMLDSFLLSAFVFAGASQFMALNLLSLGTSINEIIIATLLVNFRHFLMSASLAQKMTESMKKWSPCIAFGVTDEMFAVASIECKTLNKEFILSLQAITYGSWVMGTVIGYLLGGILPQMVQNSMGIALYAMFIAILMPEAKKSIPIALLACASGGVHAFLKHFHLLSQGWSLIVAIVCVSTLGVYLVKEEEVSECE